jgi:hypothetical protein
MRHFASPDDAIRIAESSDAAYVSAVVGSDCSEYMERVTTILSRHCVFFLEPLTRSILESHMVCSPEGRGKEALSAARAGLRYAFSVLAAAVVIGRIPVTDRPARLFTRIIGFKSDGIRPSAPGGPLVEWFEMRSEQCR